MFIVVQFDLIVYCEFNSQFKEPHKVFEACTDLGTYI
jgi:hypothetical protein